MTALRLLFVRLTFQIKIYGLLDMGAEVAYGVRFASMPVLLRPQFVVLIRIQTQEPVMALPIGSV